LETKLFAPEIDNLTENLNMDGIPPTPEIIPFQLSNAREIFNMVTGNDYIGIVPDYVTPRYCNSFFPPEDNIIDFMNLGFDPGIGKKNN